MTWADDQAFERDWWGDCANTFGEEAKQITYAWHMGLELVPEGGHWPAYDLGGSSVVDLGGGPASILLKCRNLGPALVVDPCAYPVWTALRYEAHGIAVRVAPAEEFTGTGFDEAWIYNVLQHVRDPRAIVEAALLAAPVVRMFEWVDMPTSEGHPHTLRAADLAAWLGAPGTVAEVHENGADGMAFFGVFGR